MAAKSATAVKLLMPKACSDTAGATGTGVLVGEYEGDLLITQAVGVVTAGTIVGKLQACSAADGTGAADISGAAFSSVGTSTDESVQTLVISANEMPAAKPYLRYVGTITTGPADVCVTLHARKKYLTGGD